MLSQWASDGCMKNNIFFMFWPPMVIFLQTQWKIIFLLVPFVKITMISKSSEQTETAVHQIKWIKSLRFTQLVKLLNSSNYKLTKSHSIMLSSETKFYLAKRVKHCHLSLRTGSIKKKSLKVTGRVDFVVRFVNEKWIFCIIYYKTLEVMKRLLAMFLMW